METKPLTEVFERPHALSLAEAKRHFLDTILPVFIQQYNLKTSLDVGCGYGYFSRYLKDLGLEVLAFDGRSENVIQARMRNPDVKFEVGNMEDPSIIMQYGEIDVVICLGLIYHLENPFSAIRNLFSLTKKVCLIETMVSPSASPITALVEEHQGIDQGLRHIAQVPSESWLVKVLYKVGFPFVYETTELPEHGDFYFSLIRKKKRKFVIAAKTTLSHRVLRLISEPRRTNRYIWYGFGIGYFLEHDSIRAALKLGAKLFRR